jgi:hypothetical protein
MPRIAMFSILDRSRTFINYSSRTTDQNPIFYAVVLNTPSANPPLFQGFRVRMSTD